MFTAILMSLLIQAKGDVLALVKTPDVTLTGAQVTKLNACVNANVAGAAATTKKFEVMQTFDDTEKNYTGQYKYMLDYAVELSTKDAVEQLLTNASVSITAKSAGVKTVEKKGDWTDMPDIAKTSCDAFIKDAFAPIVIADNVHFVCKSNGKGGFVCHSNYLDELSDDNFLSLKNENPTPVLRAIKRVE